MENYVVQQADAAKILEWIKTRGGILIWESINLSNAGASWTTPALDATGAPVTKPNWQCANEPSRKITNVAEVDVVTAQEVKRFHVGTRMGGSGLSVVVTDGGSRRIRSEVAKAENKHGKPAWYEFDYGSHENVVILVEGERKPLAVAV
jgi:hypothetical protein